MTSLPCSALVKRFQRRAHHVSCRPALVMVRDRGLDRRKERKAGGSIPGSVGGASERSWSMSPSVRRPVGLNILSTWLIFDPNDSI